LQIGLTPDLVSALLNEDAYIILTLSRVFDGKLVISGSVKTLFQKKGTNIRELLIAGSVIC